MNIREDTVVVLNQPLECIGNLQFISPRWPNRLDRLPDAWVKHIDPHERKVRSRGARLLGQTHDPPLLIQLGNAKLLRIGDTFQYDLRVVVAMLELLDQRRDASLNTVIAQKHYEAVIANKAM